MGESPERVCFILFFIFKEKLLICVFLIISLIQHVTLLAAAKAGYKVADMDTNLRTVAQVREALKLAECKAILFHPMTETQDNLLLLRKSIPELFYFDDTCTEQMFHSKYFPKLKYFISTGFDQEVGCLNYKYMKLPDPTTSYVDLAAEKTADATPLYFKIGVQDGAVKAGPVLTHGQVLKDSNWLFASKLIAREYVEY